MVPMYEPRIPVADPINPSSHYVEFNVRPAAKTWVRGRNWGLTVVVEDMDGTVLNAGKYFKGVACDTVGNVCECAMFWLFNHFLVLFTLI